MKAGKHDSSAPYMNSKSRNSSFSRFTALAITLTTALLFSGCAGKKASKLNIADTSSWGAEKLLVASRSAAHKSMKSSSNKDAKVEAQTGSKYAELCLEQMPENAGCYYWRAVNTGLYYSIHIIGYQRGIKQMISDCKNVIKLEPGYEQAGAYRMLGQLYTQLPQTAGRPDSITRDLTLADEYLKKSIKIAPDYPDNRLSYASTLLAEGKTSGAAKELAKARELMPHWKKDISYNEWKETTLALDKKIAKASK
jgi:hypothetical protein